MGLCLVYSGNVVCCVCSVYCGNIVSTCMGFTVEMLYGFMLGLRWFW